MLASLRSYEEPLPEGNTSGSAEDSMQLKELMVLIPTLVTRINSLEKELQETKQTLGNAVLKLVKKIPLLGIHEREVNNFVTPTKLQGEDQEKNKVLQSWRQLKHCQRLLLRVLARKSQLIRARDTGEKQGLWLKRLILMVAEEEIINCKEELLNPTPLTTKFDSVANWKIFQQGQRSVYQIIRANETDTVYMSFGAMVKDFIREDLIELTMFDPPLNEDAIWSLPLQQKMCCTKALATLEQMAIGKEISNPLIADSLLKTIRLSMHLVTTKKH
ncbi:hypothetical protein Tco_0238515 [Tanacetum coccineum]